MPAPESNRQLNIYQRINKVRETNEYLKKAKQVGEGSYSYKAVTHDQVTAAVRDDLVKHGVVIEPYMVEGHTVQDTGMRTTKSPIIRFESVWDVHFVNIDQPNERATIRVPAHALDTGDKAPGKACSYAVKMAMLKMFNIETGEEEEARKELDSVVGGLGEEAYKGWSEKISKLTAKTVKDLEDAGKLLWEMIESACKDAKDPASATKLRAQLTAKFTVMRKAINKATK